MLIQQGGRPAPGAVKKRQGKAIIWENSFRMQGPDALVGGHGLFRRWRIRTEPISRRPAGPRRPRG